MPTRDIPRADEAERAVLGSIMAHRDVILFVSRILQPADFFDARRRAVYQAALDLLSERTPCDLATIASHLEGSGKLEAVGGTAALAQYIDAAPVPVHAESYARQVFDAARRRRYLGSLGTLGQLAYAVNSDPYAEAMKALQTSRQDRGGAIVNGQDVASSLLDEMRTPLSAPRPTWGLGSIDEKVYLRPGAFVLIAGRPGVGKTSLAEGLADHNAKRGLRVLFATLEMGPDDLYRRRLCRHLGISWGHACELALLGDNDKARVAGALGEIEEWPGRVDYLPGPFSVAKLRAETLGRIAEEVLDLVIVDYAQIVDEGGRSLVEVNTAISKGLKRLALELKIPVVAVSQLNRSQGDAERPTMRSLRESGQYEQDAHSIIFLWSELENGKKLTAEGFELVNWAIGKNRNGPIGEGTLLFDGPRFQFME